jgi:hypothetical protein
MHFCNIEGAAASTNRGHYGRDQSVNGEKGNQWGTGSKKIKHAQGDVLDHQSYKKPSGNGPPSMGNGH